MIDGAMATMIDDGDDGFQLALTTTNNDGRDSSETVEPRATMAAWQWSNGQSLPLETRPERAPNRLSALDTWVHRYMRMGVHFCRILSAWFHWALQDWLCDLR